MTQPGHCPYDNTKSHYDNNVLQTRFNQPKSKPISFAKTWAICFNRDQFLFTQGREPPMDMRSR
ncbi:hypothetical protein EMIT0P43_40083 [Pseudomonas jessenii]